MTGLQVRSPVGKTDEGLGEMPKQEVWVLLERVCEDFVPGMSTVVSGGLTKRINCTFEKCWPLYIFLKI